MSLFICLMGLIGFAVASVDSQGSKTPITVIGAWSRISLSTTANNSAVYMDIQNDSDKQITLIGASAIDVANNVELHKTYVDDKGISRMAGIDQIIIPAHSTISLKPGDMHIMLFDLKRTLKDGDVFDMNLHFENMQNIKVTINVKALI